MRWSADASFPAVLMGNSPCKGVESHFVGGGWGGSLYCLTATYLCCTLRSLLTTQSAVSRFLSQAQRGEKKVKTKEEEDV